MPPVTQEQINKKLDEVQAQMEEGEKTLQTVDDRVNELAAHFGEKGEFKAAQAAIEQLEEREKKMLENIEAVKTLANRMAYSNAGARHYRGIWHSEEQSRSFGLFCMAKVGNKSAQEALKSEDADLYQRAMTTDSDAAGGALVPTEFYNRILFWAEEYGVFFRKATRWPMGSDTGVIPKVTNNLAVYCPGEGIAPTASDLATGVVGLHVKTWHTLTYYSKEIGADMAVQVGELLGRMIARAFAQKADEIGFLGDGSATYFNEVGLIPSLVAASREIEYAGDDTYAEVDLEDIDGQMADIPQYADSMAEWYGHRKPVFGILMRLARTAGGVTAVEIEGRRRLAHGGYPINIVQVMSNSQVDEAKALAFGSLADAAMWGDRQRLSVATSSDYKFAEGLETVLGTLRTCIRVVNTDAMNVGSLETSA